MAARANRQRKELAFHRRSGSGGFGSVEGCPHRIFRRRRGQHQDGTCRWPSVSRSRFCVPRVREFEKLRGNWRVAHRRFRVSCERTQVTSRSAAFRPRSRAVRSVRLYTFIGEGGAAMPPRRPLERSPTVCSRSRRELEVHRAGRRSFMITNVAPAPLDKMRAGRYAIRVETSPADGDRDIFCGDIR